MGLLFAGHETSSHAISTTLFFLHKYPEAVDKLQKELSGLIGKNHSELKELITKSSIQEFQYLYYVTKEGLRIDPPGSDALPYEVIKDVNICGVPIKKGSIINVNLLTQHYNEEEWHEPLKFIPERFDPESEYFFKPGKEQKPRDPLAWVPFSFGLRNCPGQTLALLEIKVFIAYLLSRVNFQFKKEDLESPYAYFAIASTLKLMFTHTLK